MILSEVKTVEVRRAITNFKKHPGEGLVRDFKRYKSILNKCHHNDLPEWYVLHIFYGGINQEIKRELDTNSGGSFMELTINKVW